MYYLLYHSYVTSNNNDKINSIDITLITINNIVTQIFAVFSN